MFDRFASLKRNWEGFAGNDPMWAILTDPERRGSWDREAFLASGEHAVDELLGHARKLGLAVRPGSALDFGCGLGRLTLPLARRFERAVGVDVARGMVEQARDVAAGQGNVSYVWNPEPHLRCFESGSFDLVCSLITLQHVPPEAAFAYVAEFVRLLSPEGVAVFQATSRYVGPRGKRLLRRLPHWLISLPWRWANRTPYFMEMNELPRERVERTVAGAGGRLLAVEPDRFAGDQWEGYRYFVGRA